MMSMDYSKKQKQKYKELNRRLMQYVAMVNQIYQSYNEEASRIAMTTGYNSDSEGDFKFSDYPKTKYSIEKLQRNFADNMQALIYSGISKEWKNSNDAQDLLANEILKKYKGQVNGEKQKIIYQTNSDAMKAFANRTDKGLDLSDKVWKQSDEYVRALEAAISTAISKGTSAVTLSKQISKYLIDFDKLQKDYKSQFGQATDIHDCEYRSARLARSEINMAYRTAEQTRWGQMDFIRGYRVELSNNHSDRRKKHGEYTDICDELQGDYPKDFKWTGWHPNCYKKGTMVLTSDGWKDFADVDMGDRILSLNPDTRETEWVGITDKQVFRHSGKMVRFFNNSLECVVTPEHSMVYINKTNGEIRRLPAIEYRKGNGAFYRSCLYDNNDIQTIDINGKAIDFDLFCEFMGYYLSDGSLMRNSGVALCQMEGEKARDKMVRCLVKIGLKPCLSHDKVSFYDSRINRYLKQFGTSSHKYIPDEILNASKRQIRIFLDAFIICDGHERKCKTFIGNRGNVFIPKNTEKQYFTSSQRMAGNICELLLKSGHRPSFAIRQPVSTTRKNGKTISGNYPVFIIRECLSNTATVFDKELVDYDDNVYDLTLERNHIMYIAVNGKCFWGSNCRCHAVPIMMSEEDFIKWNNGEQVEIKEIKDVPEAFKQWVAENSDKISTEREKHTLPYFVRDNSGYVSQSIKNTENIKELIKELTETSTKTVTNPLNGKLPMDITGGIASLASKSITSLINKFYVAQNNSEQVSILRQIISDRNFEKLNYHSSKSNYIYAIGYKAFDKELKVGEMPANISIAKKMVANEYDVYILPNPNSTVSADFIFRKKGMLYYTEGKTMYGKNSLDNRLRGAAKQSGRVIVDVIGTDDARYISSTIKTAFENNGNLSEITLLKGSRIIKVTRKDTINKNYYKIFKKEWNKQK